MIREKFRPEIRVKRRKVLVIGAGEAGIMVLKETQLNPSTNLEVVGFIDDDNRKIGLRIQGVPILGAVKDIPDIVKGSGVEDIIIAIPSAKGEAIRRIVSYCQIPFIRIRIVPGLQKILTGDLEVKPREIRPEDLLGRETVSINEEEVKNYISGKVVLVTGAGGSIGSALCRQIVNFNPKEIIFFDHNENEVYYFGKDARTINHFINGTYGEYPPQVGHIFVDVNDTLASAIPPQAPILKLVDNSIGMKVCRNNVPETDFSNV